MKRGDTLNIAMADSPDTPQRWADLSPKQQERILKLSELTDERLDNIIRAGGQIEWWQILGRNIWAFKWLILAIGGLLTWLNGGLAALTAFFLERVIPAAML